MNPYQLLTNVTPFPFWNAYTPTLPSFYWNVDSQEERIKKICLTIHKLMEYVEYLGGNLNLDQKAIEELQEDFQQFQESGFEQYYEAQLHQWIQDNAAALFSEMAKLVMFGLTDDGHFCAYIPDSWSDIWFDTIVSVDDPLYGHLVIMWDGNGDFSNPQGPSSNERSYETLQYKPKINGVELVGDLAFSDLGLNPITDQQVDDAFGGEE